MMFVFQYSDLTILISLITGFISGCSLTWTSPEITYLNTTDTGPFNGTLTQEEASWIGGLLSIGAIFGPFLFGYLSDRIGRKYSLLSVSIPYLVSYVICAFANKVAEFYVARFITGLGVGGAFTLLPMYIGEMASDEHRGALGSGMNSFICFGLLFSYIVGYFIKSVMYFNILLAAICGAFFVLFLFLGSETPQYYIQKDQIDLARSTLMKMRGSTKDVTEKELDIIRTEIEKEEKGGIIDIFRSKGNTKAFIIGSGLVFFQQMSGINAVLFFAQSIFEQAGTTLEPAYCSMIIGGVQFSTSFITPLVSNTFGRKFLLISSGVGMFLSECALGIYLIVSKNNPDSETLKSLGFLPIIALVFYIITYNVGFGPLPWAVIGEIFPNSVKASAGALATGVCWFTSFVITKWFSQLVQNVGQGQCFIGFACFSLLSAVFTQFVVLETRGKTLAQIQIDLNR